MYEAKHAYNINLFPNVTVLFKILIFNTCFCKNMCLKRPLYMLVLLFSDVPFTSVRYGYYYENLLTLAKPQKNDNGDFALGEYL